MYFIHTAFYSHIRSIVSRFIKRCRTIISGLRKSKNALLSVGFTAKDSLLLKQGEGRQQMVLLPFVSILRKQQEKLIKLSGNTEEEFLSLGVKLQDISSKAKSLPERLVHIAELIKGGGEHNFFDQSKYVSEKSLTILKMFDAETKEIILKINSIVEQIKKFSKNKNDFKIISRTLRVLGINIKIQGVQIIGDENNSIGLADEVSGLSIKTDVIVDKLFDELGKADVSVLLIADRINRHLQKNSRQIKQAEKRINNVLGRLKEMFDLSAGLLTNITSCSSEISKRVGEIVMSMQFHDISRQKIEHVSEALEDICKKLEEDTKSGNGDESSLPAYILKIAAVQISQLDFVTHEMETAEKKMVEGLEDIALNTKKQSEELIKATGVQEKESDNSVVIKFRDEITTIISALTKNAENNNYIQEEVKGVSKTAKAIFFFIGNVEEIAEKIKLLALNAQIEAARIGESGLALSILAREVRDVSAHSNRVVDTISAGVKLILDIADRLQIHISDAFTKGLNDVEDLRRTAVETGEGLNNLNNEMAENIVDFNGKSQQLALDISAIKSEIRFFREMKECIFDAKMVINQLIEAVRPFAAENKTDSDESLLTELNVRYTMESERIAHENAFRLSHMENCDSNALAEKICGDEVFAEPVHDEDDGDIELFEDFDAEDEQTGEVEVFDKKEDSTAAADDDDELGDNIELF